MEINSLASQYMLNQAYLPMGSLGSQGSMGSQGSSGPLGSSNLSPSLVRAGEGPDFSEILEKANLQKKESEQPETPVLAAGKATIDRDSKLFEMCQEFETFLLKTLVSTMRNTVQKSNLIDSGFAGQFYEDMLYDEYAKDMAKNAGFGFAEMAYLELSGQRGKTL